MFQVDGGSRKRPRPIRLHNAKKSTPTSTNDVRAASVVLQGVVVSVTGLHPDDKERLHQLIVELGGRYTRNLDVNVNTHLIANTAEGAKFQLASSTQSVSVVRQDWLDECYRRCQRVDERLYATLPSHDGEPDERIDSNDEVVRSLSDELNFLLENSENSGSVLFSACQFHLVGFESNNDAGCFLPLGRLIRRGLGTIYWEFHEGITHVIFNNHSDAAIQDVVAKFVKSQYNNNHGPVFVSPHWVTKSWSMGALQIPSRFPPIYRSQNQVKGEKGFKSDAPENTTVTTSTIFHGSVFVLFRLVPPPGTVDFDSMELEQLIQWNGGQMLSLKMVEALKVDVAGTKKRFEKRNCYVVAWGGHSPAHLEIHPLLSQVKRYGLCVVKQVTPVWLRTCLSEKQCLRPSLVPEIFVPNGHPLCSFTPAAEKGSTKASAVRISLTGFKGAKRSAIAHLIEAMGAKYDDSMRSNTTHLICREASGEKYKKAMEWKLHVLPIEWLYHVSEFGLCGETGD